MIVRGKKEEVCLTFTTSSRPLASLRIRLFLASRTLATRKTGSASCWSLDPLFTFFLSNLPYRFRCLSFPLLPTPPVEADPDSYDKNMFGLYSMAHIIWNQSILLYQLNKFEYIYHASYKLKYQDHVVRVQMFLVHCFSNEFVNLKG